MVYRYVVYRYWYQHIYLRQTWLTSRYMSVYPYSNSFSLYVSIRISSKSISVYVSTDVKIYIRILYPYTYRLGASQARLQLKERENDGQLLVGRMICKMCNQVMYHTHIAVSYSTRRQCSCPTASSGEDMTSDMCVIHDSITDLWRKTWLLSMRHDCFIWDTTHSYVAGWYRTQLQIFESFPRIV